MSVRTVSRSPSFSATLARTIRTAALTHGSDDESPKTEDEPSQSSPTKSVDDEAAIEDVVAAYDRALVTVNQQHDVTPQLTAVATDDWAEQLVTTYDDNLFANGLEMVGRWRSQVESVSVAGDQAEADVCSDGNKVYVVEGGGSIPSGTRSQGRTPAVISLVREDDGWQVDGNAIGEGKC